MENQLNKLYDEDFRSSFVHLGYITFGRNTTFCDVDAYMDDRFIYIDNGDYLMVYPATAIKHITLRNCD